MPYHFLDGRYCSGSPLDEFNPDGTIRRAVYFYKGTEGGELEVRTTNNLLLCPDDNGDSWGTGDVQTGAIIYLWAPDTPNLQPILERLVRCHNNRERIGAVNLGGATHGAPAPGVTDVFLTPETTPQAQLEDWERLGFPDKASWKAAKRRGEI